MGEEYSSMLSNMAQLGIEITAEKDKIIVVTEEVDGDEIVEIKDEQLDTAEASKRSLRKRSNSDDSLHRTRQRKIQKPKKNNLQFETEKEVKNFYLNVNKKMKKVKPNLLETIFEADESLTDSQEGHEANGKGTGRKLKRTLAICDGFNITKSLKEKRKGLIRKHLGNKKKPQKMALAKFMEYFKEKTVKDNAGAVMESI